jgi:hypothetical protein
VSQNDDTIDFNDLVDSVLVACAEAQGGERVMPCDVYEICRSVHPACPPTWLEMTFSRLIELGYGKKTTDYARPAARLFKINGNGVARAAEVRRIRSRVDEAAPAPIFNNNVTVSPVFNNSNHPATKAGDGAAWFGAWGTWAAALVAVLAILVTLRLAGKI